MNKSVLALLFPLFLYGESLKELIVYAEQNNDLVQAKVLQKDAKAKELESTKSSIFPTLDLGGSYSRDDDPQPFAPGSTYTGFAKLSVDLYKGGATLNKIRQLKDEIASNSANTEAAKKLLSLQITQDFYKYKNLQASLEAREEASKAVAAQLGRMKKFYEAKLATSDEVDRLQAAYDQNIYAIESLKFEILALKKGLELEVGKTIGTFDRSEFQKEEGVEQEKLDSIEALSFQKNSLIHHSEILDRYYYPQIRLENTYTFFKYENKPNLGGSPLPLLDKQNSLMITANMRLFDFGTQSEAKQAMQLQAQALESEVRYKTKEQQNNMEIAKERIKAAKLNIKSATSALRASKSALETITQKYNNHIVDNVVYLDALSSYTEAKATYSTAQNNLEVAYALYYFYNGKKLEEFLDE